jgi:hypothetical protein
VSRLLLSDPLDADLLPRSYVSSVCMLCCLSWTSFALPPHYVQARLATVITLVLSLMALSQVITPSLPQTGEQTAGHTFLFQANLFLVLGADPLARHLTSLIA